VRAYSAGPMVSGPLERLIPHIRVDLDALAALQPTDRQADAEGDLSEPREVPESLIGCYYLG
jgi:hypothetical protein